MERRYLTWRDTRCSRFSSRTRVFLRSLRRFCTSSSFSNTMSLCVSSSPRCRRNSSQKRRACGSMDRVSDSGQVRSPSSSSSWASERAGVSWFSCAMSTSRSRVQALRSCCRKRVWSAFSLSCFWSFSFSSNNLLKIKSNVELTPLTARMDQE